MKKLEFETSKGNFVLVEDGSSVFNECMCSNNYKLICRLKGITEEQASEIVDSSMGNKNFLLFLLKSKGVHLFENPYEKYDLQTMPKALIDYKEAEQNTFYNPYIFKIK